jgi:hypothetical protein
MSVGDAIAGTTGRVETNLNFRLSSCQQSCYAFNLE